MTLNYETEQRRLRAAFDLVAPKGHWKDPIDAVVSATADQDEIREAVIHFTGSIPRFTPVAAGFRVRAAGYYAAIGA